MSAKSFYTDEAKKSVSATIAAIEGVTSAEVVVTLRAASGSYRHADYLAGAVLTFAGLCFFLFYPADFRTEVFPIEALLLFIGGSALSAYLPPLRRLFSSRAHRAESVLTAARAAFVAQGISRTRGRSGILVFVSMLERRVEIVADIGVDEEALGAPWKEARARLAGSIAGDPTIERFIEALAALGPALHEKMPRAEDDVNELSDEVVSA
ncbi:MAG: hypothetical protein U0359_32870 [Byssovorax sp.]